MSADISHQRLRELLNYEADTGYFTWKYPPRGRVAGRVAGCKRADGYILIRLDGHLYLAHRLAWLYANGEMPVDLLDHIDGDPSNNRLSNLRPATAAQNQQNREAIRISGDYSSRFVGVSWSKQHQSWEACLVKDRRRFRLGLFEREDQAAEAYISAKMKYHDFCPVPRSSAVINISRRQAGG